MLKGLGSNILLYKYVFDLLCECEFRKIRVDSVLAVALDSFNLGLNISSSSTNVKSYWPNPSLFKSSISKGSGDVKNLPREWKRYSLSTESLNLSVKKIQKYPVPDLTMILKWSWLGMSVLNCCFWYWIVEMEDRRLRL